MFELSQLRGFIAVAEELHFGRAAARLNMTQPPLSRQIQLLEHALGVVLLARTSRSVQLTPAGQVLLGEARRLLRMAESAERTTRRVARGEAGQVTLGFTAASSYAFLPRLLTLARSGLPEVRIALRELVTQDQVEALVSGAIDLGLVRPPVARRGIETARVLREPLLLALPSGHALAAGRTPVPADLDRQPFVSYSPVEGRYFHALCARLFQAAGVAPDIVQHVSQTHSILALVRAGLGLALVPEAARSLGLEGVVLREIEAGAPLFADLFLAWRPDNGNPAMAPLRDLLLRDLPGPAVAG